MATTGSRPEVRAHRGASLECPENTLAAFARAIELGADGLEFDVHPTRDGALVVVHDYDLARTTTGSGLVHELGLDDIRSLSAGAWFGDAFVDERVPLLSEVLELEGVAFELELKGLPGRRYVEAVVAAVLEAGVADRTEFTGFHPTSLQVVRELLPGARLGLFAPGRQAWMTTHLYHQVVEATAALGGHRAVHVALDELDGAWCARLHDLGFLVAASGPVNAPEALRSAIALGLDQWTTDDPALARSVVDDGAYR